MDIYTTEGADTVVDLRRAAAELKGSSSITSGDVRRAIVAEIHAAALLDIALSLRVLAAESRAAMVGELADIPEYGEGEPAEVDDFFVVGDVVLIDDEAGSPVATITHLGMSEGSVVATLLLDGGETVKAWTDCLTRVTPEPPGEGDEVGEPIVGRDDPVDDIDSDFDGDPHETATSALDTLKRNEAERKADKKKGGKKP